MRIDEFSISFNGTLSSTELTRFLLFGFDIGLLAPSTSLQPSFLLRAINLIDKTRAINLIDKTRGVSL